MLIGLTGGIACGKSSVMSVFVDQGFVSLSADQVVHRLMLKKAEAYEPIFRRFGNTILNSFGEIDRSILGEIVFSDKGGLQDLENILHPLVSKHFHQWKTEHQHERAIYELPLLFEKSKQDDFDMVICVSSSPSIQLQRLMQRDGLEQDEAMKRIDSQMPLEKKESLSDHVIRNDFQKVEDLHPEVIRLIKNL